MKLTDITTELIVAEEKLTKYLLNLDNKRGRAKAIFFMKFGFEIQNREQLAEALRQHAIVNEITFDEITDYGHVYRIEGPVLSPDDRHPHIRAAWQIDNGKTHARFITAHTLKGKWT